MIAWQLVFFPPPFGARPQAYGLPQSLQLLGPLESSLRRLVARRSSWLVPNSLFMAADESSSPAGAVPLVERRKQHRTYTAYVSHGGDVIGLVAYALYKKDKIAFCTEVERMQGRPPTADELSAFIRSVNMPQHIEMARTRAEGILESITEQVLAVSIEDLQSEYDKKLIERLEKARNPVTAFISDVFSNLAASVILLIVTGAILLSQVEIFPTIGKVLGYQVQKADQGK
jgi:hypothetical protein